LFDSAADGARADYRKESYWFGAYHAIAGDSLLGEPLDRWVAARPESAPARIARAAYLEDMAWSTRGSAYARDTPDEQMKRKDRLLARAVSDIDSALARTPRSAAAYLVRLEIARDAGDPATSRRYLLAGLEDIPASFVLRRQFIRNLVPRWGGSYEAMRAFVDESHEMADSNPRLRALAGYIQLDSAEVLELQDDQARALSMYTRALASGDEEIFHLERGQLLVRMGRYREAMVDLDQAVASAPGDSRAYFWRGMARQGQRDTNDKGAPHAASGALTDYQRAVILDPMDTAALDRFAWLYAHIH
jgi:tetratricopeptide (TPR) repeat protein